MSRMNWLKCQTRQNIVADIRDAVIHEVVFANVQDLFFDSVRNPRINTVYNNVVEHPVGCAYVRDAAGR